MVDLRNRESVVACHSCFDVDNLDCMDLSCKYLDLDHLKRWVHRNRCCNEVGCYNGLCALARMARMKVELLHRQEQEQKQLVLVLVLKG